jgi:hypothetical protein
VLFVLLFFSECKLSKIETLNKKIVKNICADCGRCCSGCAKYLGYFRVGSLYLKDITSSSSIIDLARKQFYDLARKYHFNMTKGFLTSKGCRLPWEKRSVMCLSYFCGDHFQEIDGEVFEDLNMEIQMLRTSRVGLM